jgi:hypothetical protein
VATMINRISGKTYRWSFVDGPTSGKTYEHTFGEDGTVSYSEIGESQESAAKTASGKAAASEHPKYAVFEVTDDVVTVSYLAPSGFTLTVVLNFDDGRLVGFASNDKQWFPVRGTFEEVRSSSKDQPALASRR